MPPRLATLATLLAGLVTLAASADLSAQAPKRPLKHSDYEIWNTATGVKLSPDGKYIAYVLTPPEGDAHVIVRNLPTGAEQRIAIAGKSGTATAGSADPAAVPGAEPTLPTPGPGGPAGRGAAAAAGGPQFTPDSKFLIVSLTPTKAAVEKAKADKADAPKAELAFFELATGKIATKLNQVKSFNVVGEGAGVLLYQKEAKTEAPKADAPKADPMAGGAVGGAAAVTPKQPATPPAAGTRPTGPRSGTGTASDLYVRNLADGSEIVYPDVTEYQISRDAKQITYAMSGKVAEQAGVYIASLTGPVPGTAVKTGAGKYTRLTWDEGQNKLAFFHTEPPATSAVTSTESGGGAASTSATTTPAKLRVFVWEKTAKGQTTAVSTNAPDAKVNPALEVISPTTAGLKAGSVVVERGGLTFSADGLKLYVATAPAATADATPPTTPAPTGTASPTPPAGGPVGPGGPGGGRFGPRAGLGGAPGAPAEEKVDLDLWHWKDDLIQPMQKIRGATDRLKTFRAVVFLDTNTFRQLADEDTDVTTPTHGDWGLASSDKRFHGMQWLSPTPRDYGLLNIRTGDAKPLMQGAVFGPQRSPKGKYLLSYDGKDWSSIAVPEGKRVNLTEKLPSKFFNEEDDHPAEPPPHGVAGWTSDEKFVLLYDRIDIWKVAADGSGAENLTKGGKESQLKLRYLKLADETDTPDERGIDLTKPMFLTAENLETRDTGFYKLEPGNKPKLLVMGARRYGPPTKAKKADTLLLTISTFYDVPDYYATGPDFREFKRVTDIQPRKAEFNWGKAELIHYKSADGLPLSGMLIKPEDFDPAKKYPMIVYIYERLTNTLHGFRLPTVGTSINPTYYASNGYLVYMPDIAYTIGSPGQSAMKCVLPAIQAVADKGYLNEAAIGIQGHSWGGYQIAYMVTQTNRFKAAEAGAPVSNMTSAYSGIRWGTGLPRQFQYEKTQSRIGATLWQAPMKYLENSPVFMADRVNTPLMILHNDQDDAVPWYQGIEYYLALRRLGKEVYLFNYNGEFHGLRKKATQKDYTVRMQQFFDHHLKGTPAPDWMTTGIPYADRDKEKEQWKKLFQPEKK